MSIAETLQVQFRVRKSGKRCRINLGKGQGVVERLFAIGEIGLDTGQHKVGHNTPMLGALAVYPKELRDGEFQLTEGLLLIFRIGVKVYEILYGSFPVGRLPDDDAASIILYRP